MTDLLADLEQLRREHGYVAVADGYFMTCCGDPCGCGASEANAKLDRIIEQDRWRKWPEEQPPETETFYLIINEGKIMLWRWTGVQWGRFGGPRGCTHWRPLPTPPDTKEE